MTGSVGELLSVLVDPEGLDGPAEDEAGGGGGGLEAVGGFRMGGAEGLGGDGGAEDDDVVVVVVVDGAVFGLVSLAGGARAGGVNSVINSSSPPPNLPEALIGGEDEVKLDDLIGGEEGPAASLGWIGGELGGGTALGASAGFFVGAAVALGPPASLAPPARYFTSAFSNASFTFAIFNSSTPSIYGLNVLSPTIFINVPKHSAAEVRIGSKLSPNKVTSVSAIGLIWSFAGASRVVCKER